MSIYPNPTNNILNIQSDAYIEHVEMIAMDGRVLANFDQEIVSKNYTVDVSSFVPGIYFAKVFTSNGSIVSKFIKQ